MKHNLLIMEPIVIVLLNSSMHNYINRELRGKDAKQLNSECKTVVIFLILN